MNCSLPTMPILVRPSRCADCRTEEDCEIRRVFARVAVSAREVLDRTSIADAIAVTGRMAPETESVH